jgi:hypothetical protein
LFIEGDRIVVVDLNVQENIDNRGILCGNLHHVIE